MIPNIAHHGPHSGQRSTVSTAEAPPSTDPAAATGKASAPGQVAKALIAEATSGGAELPANIQGRTASAIAHGVDMDSFFASFLPVVDPPVDEVPDGGIGDSTGDIEVVAPDDPGDVVASPPEADDATPAPLTGAGASAEEIAAALLEPLLDSDSETAI